MPVPKDEVVLETKAALKAESDSRKLSGGHNQTIPGPGSVSERRVNASDSIPVKDPSNPSDSSDHLGEAANDGHPQAASDAEGKSPSADLPAFCLPAKPLVSGESSASSEDTSDNDDASDVHQYFKGHTGRCHIPSYTCPDSSTPIISSTLLDSNPSESHCFLPRLVQQQERDMKRFRVVQIHRRQSTPKQSVLFVGNVWDLVDGGLRTSDFVPRDWFVARLLSFAKLSALPRELETVFLLTAGLSAGLAVVNMLPIYGLDGYHIVDAVVHASVSKGWEGRRAARLVKIISYVALAIALLTIFCSVSLSL